MWAGCCLVKHTHTNKNKNLRIDDDDIKPQAWWRRRKRNTHLLLVWLLCRFEEHEEHQELQLLQQHREERHEGEALQERVPRMGTCPVGRLVTCLEPLWGKQEINIKHQNVLRLNLVQNSLYILGKEYIVRCWVWGLLKMLHRDFVSSAVHFLGVKKHAGSWWWDFDTEDETFFYGNNEWMHITLSLWKTFVLYF